MTQPTVVQAISILRAELRAQGDEPLFVYLASDVYDLLWRELELPEGTTDLKVLGMPVNRLDGMVPGTIRLSSETIQ